MDIHSGYRKEQVYQGHKIACQCGGCGDFISFTIRSDRKGGGHILLEEHFCYPVPCKRIETGGCRNVTG